MLKASPLEKYNVPKYPSASSFKPEGLRELPKRWLKSKKVLLCIGAAGTLMLAGCSADEASTPGEYYEQATPFVNENIDSTPFFDRFLDRTPLLDRIMDRLPFTRNRIDQMFVAGHLMPIDLGGAAMSPCYVATFTEQEAINILMREAAAAGLNLTVADPDRSFEIINHCAEWDRYLTQEVPILFVDEDRAIAIAYIHEWVGIVTWGRWNWGIGPSITEIVNSASPRGGEEAIAVFINPRGSRSLTSWGPWGLWDLREEISEYIAEKGYDLSPEQMDALIDEMYEERLSAYMDGFAANALNEVEERLILQVRDFVEWLEGQGILDAAP